MKDFNNQYIWLAVLTAMGVLTLELVSHIDLVAMVQRYLPFIILK